MFLLRAVSAAGMIPRKGLWSVRHLDERFRKIRFSARYKYHPISSLETHNTAMSLTFKLNDGAQIPWLGFGTGTALFNKDSTEAVKVAIQTGVTHLDGAQLYRNEESLGQGIKDSGVPREKLFVTTKLAETPSAPTIKATLEESLKKLGLEYVDLFLIHSPVVALREGKLKQWWKEMEEIKKEGLAKVSRFFCCRIHPY